MQPHTLRLVVFVVLSLVFSSAVWIVESEGQSSRALLAQAGGASAPKNVADHTANKQCPLATTHSYAECEETSAFAPSSREIQFASALAVAQKPNGCSIHCYYKQGDLAVQGKCVGSNRCRGQRYIDGEGNLCTLSVTGGSCQAAGAAGQKAYAETQKLIDQLKEETAGEAILQQADANFNNAFTDAVKPIQQGQTTAGGNITGPKSPAAPIAQTGPGGQTGTLPGGQTPIGQIGQIGGATPGNTSGGAQSGSSNRQQPTFRFSPILGNIANWVIANNNGGGGGGGGSSGATVAYAPQGDLGYYNRNFEATDAQITFPDARPSPADILAYLAQNSKRQQGDTVTAEELTDRGVVNTVVLQAINNVVTPVGDFIRSIFAGEEASPPSGEDVSTAAKEEKPPLERGRLVLTLSADDSLVAGDPTSLAPPGRPTYEAFESIPSSNRAWVQNAPRAGEGIEGIASAPPTYGWGEPAQEGDAGETSVAEEANAPEVSSVLFEPFFPRFGFEGDEEEKGSPEPPRSFFSVMGKSFVTIGDAVGSLFSNIGKSLFWWL